LEVSERRLATTQTALQIMGKMLGNWEWRNGVDKR